MSDLDGGSPVSSAAASEIVLEDEEAGSDQNQNLVGSLWFVVGCL